MRILVINWRDISHPEAGGAEVHIHEIFSRMVLAGHEVTLLCSLFPNAPVHEQIDGVSIIRHGSKFTFNLTVPGFYRSNLAASNFDIVVEALNKVPFFLPSQLPVPVMAIVHHLFGLPVFLETNPVFASLIYITERLIPFFYKKALFEAISESSRDELVHMGIAAGQIQVINCGLDWNRFHERGHLHEKTEPVILSMGRLKRYKNIHHVIQVMPRVRSAIPGARLVIAGGGDYRPALEALVLKMGLQDAVQFVGFVSEEEKVAWFRRAMVSVYPSSKEGWGLTVIEANACYTPVVAANVPGLKDAVVHDQTGLLFPVGDLSALAEALIQLLLDQATRERLALGAGKWAERFTWDEAAIQTLALMERAIREHRAP